MKYEYIIGAFLAVLSFLMLIGSMIMVMFCFMRMDFKFSWIAATLAFGSLASILMKIYLFNY